MLDLSLSFPRQVEYKYNGEWLKATALAIDPRDKTYVIIESRYGLASWAQQSIREIPLPLREIWVVTQHDSNKDYHVPYRSELEARDGLDTLKMVGQQLGKFDIYTLAKFREVREDSV